MASIDGHGFARDLAAAADLGWGPDAIDRMARIGFASGDLATFMGLERDTRQLVLRLLSGAAAERDLVDLEQHPQCRALSQWLITLPAFRGGV